MDHMNTTLTKTCSKCGEDKELTDFTLDKRNRDGRGSYCRVCHQEYVKKYRKNNREKINQYQNQYKKSSKLSKEYRKKYYEENKDKISSYMKEYYEKNKDYFAAATNKRRATKLQATPTWITQDHLDEIQKYYAFRANVSGVVGKGYEVDHIVPLQGENVCGLHVPWNLQVITKESNRSKGNNYNDWN